MLQESMGGGDGKIGEEDGCYQCGELCQGVQGSDGQKISKC